MSFEAGSYISSLVLPLATAQAPLRGPLTQQEAGILADKLANDSQKCIYSSLISIAAAVQGLEQGHTTWPTVKLYYSSFYSIRAILALANVCLYYSMKKPFWIEGTRGAYPAQAPSKARGSTHKFVFSLFEQRFSNSPLLSQTIDEKSPFEWLMTRREDANYRIARFIEPGENQFFKFVKKTGVRKLCIEYLQDDYLVFDPDHAILAYPLYLLRHISKTGVRGKSCLLGEEEDRSFEMYFTDGFGPIQPLIDLKRNIIL